MVAGGQLRLIPCDPGRQPGYCVGLLLRQHVGVLLKREGGTAVAQAQGDNVWRDAVQEEECRMGVPQSMERNGPSGTSSQWQVVPVDRWGEEDPCFGGGPFTFTPHQQSEAPATQAGGFRGQFAPCAP